MTSIVNIQLGSGDNIISIETMPTFRLELDFVVESHVGVYNIRWFAKYYMRGMECPMIKLKYITISLKKLM